MLPRSQYQSHPRPTNYSRRVESNGWGWGSEDRREDHSQRVPVNMCLGALAKGKLTNPQNGSALPAEWSRLASADRLASTGRMGHTCIKQDVQLPRVHSLAQLWGSRTLSACTHWSVVAQATQTWPDAQCDAWILVQIDPGPGLGRYIYLSLVPLNRLDRDCCPTYLTWWELPQHWGESRGLGGPSLYPLAPLRG